MKLFLFIRKRPTGIFQNFRVLFFFLILWFFNNSVAFPSKISAEKEKKEDHQQYIDFFEKIYKTMEENYYQPVNRLSYDKFLKNFDSKIYKKLKKTGKSNNFIRWRSAAYLVDYLKVSEDTFSAFYPPKPAKEYEQEALGKKFDLGLEGNKIEKGFLVTFVEPRSDAYLKGIREDDVILKINNFDIASVNEETIKEYLTPLEGTLTVLDYFDVSDAKERKTEVLSQEYFKQTVFLKPVSVPGVYCLQVDRFNRKTSDDMLRYLEFIKSHGQSDLVIDLRGNPGGPPLAAREISSFFLPPGEEFAYFEKRGQPKSLLTVPEIPERYHYKGDIVILVDKKSGSASELFSGILQKRGRAVLIGQNTAGKVMLKSMFPFEDESMVLLVTARGHYPDGKVFSFKGLVPDVAVQDDKIDLVEYAARYLTSKNKINF